MGGATSRAVASKKGSIASGLGREASPPSRSSIISGEHAESARTSGAKREAVEGFMRERGYRDFVIHRCAR